MASKCFSCSVASPVDRRVTQFVQSHEAHASLSKLKPRMNFATSSLQTVLSVCVCILLLKKIQEHSLCQQDPKDPHKTFKGNISVTLTIKTLQYQKFLTGWLILSTVALRVLQMLPSLTQDASFCNEQKIQFKIAYWFSLWPFWPGEAYISYRSSFTLRKKKTHIQICM